MFGHKSTPTDVARKQMAEAKRDLQTVGKKVADAARLTVRDVAKTKDAKRVRKHGQATQEAIQDLAKTAVKVGRHRARTVTNSKEMKRARVSTRKAADAAKYAVQATSTKSGAHGKMAASQARASGQAAALKAQARALKAARKRSKP